MFGKGESFVIFFEISWNPEGSEIIKNTYRTLMTRGMRGCYVYATDPALREYLKRRATDVGEGWDDGHHIP